MTDGLTVRSPAASFVAPQENAAPTIGPYPEAAGVQAPGTQPAAALAGSGDTQTSRSAGERQITNPNGAPEIGVPRALSPHEMVRKLQSLKLATQQGQMRTAMVGVDMTRQKLDEVRKEALEKLEEVVRKNDSAEAKSKYAKIFSWAAKIGAFAGSLLAVAGSLAAVVLSGGAAAPLLVLAVTGLVSSSISLISAIRQERGGEPLDINIGVTMACKALLTEVGVPEEKLEAASKIMAGSLGMITGAAMLDPQLYGSLASGVVLMTTGNENWAAVAAAGATAYTTMAIAAVMFIANPGSASTQVQKAMAQIPQLANTIKHALSAFSATGAGISALINIGVSFDAHGAAMAQVDRQKFSALIAKLQAQMATDSEQITEIVKDIQQAMSLVSKMIMQAIESQAQIIANVGRFMA